MAAYVIVDSNVHDPEGIKGYAAKVLDTLAPYGGKLIASAPDPEVIEGDWTPQRIVIGEFPDVDSARAWYNSPEYQQIVPIRLAAANDAMLIVPGL